MLSETLVHLGITVVLLALTVLAVRFTLRVRKHFVVDVLHIRGEVGRRVIIKNKGNCHGLRNGKNQFYVVIRDSEVSYHKTLTNLEIELLSADDDVQYFRYHQVWLRGGGAYKFEEFDIKGVNSIIDWRTI